MKKRHPSRLLAALLAALMLLSLAACAASAPDTADPSDPAAQTQQSQPSGTSGKKDDASAKSDATKADDKQDAEKADEQKKDTLAEPVKEQEQKDEQKQEVPSEKKEEEEKDEQIKEEKKEEQKQEEQKKEEQKAEEPKKEESKKEEPKQDTSNKQPSGTTSTTPSTPSAPPSTPSTPSKSELTCTISISCSSVLRNMDKCSASVRDYIPSNGTILSNTTITISQGDTVLDVLTEVCSEYGISLEYSFSPTYGSYYIEGINNLYEKDVGDTSGWMYKVNGSFPSYGCSSYKLQGGERIAWVYTCDLGSDVGGSGAL